MLDRISGRDDKMAGSVFASRRICLFTKVCDEGGDCHGHVDWRNADLRRVRRGEEGHGFPGVLTILQKSCDSSEPLPLA